MSCSRMRIVSMRAAMILFVFIIAFCPAGIAIQKGMPFNGTIVFHKITLTIPNNYVRDSTQSTEDFWIFEKGFYSKYIMLSRKDIPEDINDFLNSYVNYLKEQGAQSQRQMFLQQEAVRSEDMRGDTSWQEIMFVHDDSLYVTAMRGGTAEEMQALIDSIALHDETPEIIVQPDHRTPIERMFGYFFGR